MKIHYVVHFCFCSSLNKQSLFFTPQLYSHLLWAQGAFAGLWFPAGLGSWGWRSLRLVAWPPWGWGYLSTEGSTLSLQLLWTCMGAVGANPNRPWPMGSPCWSRAEPAWSCRASSRLFPGWAWGYRGCTGLRAPPAPGHPEGLELACREPQYGGLWLLQGLLSSLSKFRPCTYRISLDSSSVFN